MNMFFLSVKTCRVWCFCFAGLLLAHGAYALPADSGNLGNVAFYYGSNLPLDELRAFDVVVVEPSRTTLPNMKNTPHTRWFARLTVRSGDWQKHQEQAARYVSERVQPLVQAGYQGLLLDDLSGIGDETPERRQVMVALVEELAFRYPELALLVRNHTGLAKTHADQLAGLVVDSLYQQKQGFGGLMAKVPAVVRNAALTDIRLLQQQSDLDVIAIDYCSTGDKACQRQLAGQLLADRLQPYVTNAAMDVVGQGRIEVMPRKVLLLEQLEHGQPLDESFGVLNLAMPLNYLGYDIEYADLNNPLPNDIGNDRYAGIVLAGDSNVSNPLMLQSWLLQQIEQGLRVAVFNDFGFALNMQNAPLLDLEFVPEQRVSFDSKPEILQQDEMLGFEAAVNPDIRDALGARVGSNSKTLLRLKSGRYIYDAAAITPWGGFVVDNNAVVYLDSLEQQRWIINPMLFLQQALRLPQMPVPDVTTENGRRLFFTHVDGDGFLSYGEFSQTGSAPQFCSAILKDEVFKRYPVPMSMSIIQAELTEMDKQARPQLEKIAREIFALPNVEIASHTYSHPYFWSHVDPDTGIKHGREQLGNWYTEGVSSLQIPGYDFDIDKEISGSIDYINRELAPENKQVKAIFWSGDAIPPRIGLKKAAAAGVLNINAGNTTITRSNNTWTQIGPYGVAKGDGDDEFQVYAAVMNENLYTNDWTGPFYGFRRALETFELTNHPLRIKPVNIYYHSYSASKPSSLKALHSLFEQTLKQDVLPIYTTEYIQRVLDWRHVVVAREGDRWIVRSGEHMRQLRWPGQGVPDLSTASGITGYVPGPGGLYVHMASDEVSFSMAAVQPVRMPRISEAAGFVRNVQRSGKNLAFDFGGYYRPAVWLEEAAGCRVRVNGKPVRPELRGALSQIVVQGNAGQQVVYHQVQVDCE